ncbi:hypothetical protein [Streptomyces canarius]
MPRSSLERSAPIAPQDDLSGHMLVTQVADIMYSKALDYAVHFNTLMKRRYDFLMLRHPDTILQHACGIGFLKRPAISSHSSRFSSPRLRPAQTRSAASFQRTGGDRHPDFASQSGDF